MTFDHTSILKLIEWRFGLARLTLRDASHDIQNLARALNFHTVNAALLLRDGYIGPYASQILTL
jgi:hypothetical protein